MIDMAFSPKIKDDAKYLVSMMFRTSIDPPKSVGIGEYWTI